MPKPADELVALAEVTKPHGLRGEFRLKVYNRESDVVLSLRELLLETKEGEHRVVSVTASRRVPEGVLMSVGGCTSRETAEALRGARVLVARGALPALGDGEFYAFDVQGARVVVGDDEIGRVEEMVTYPTCDVLIIATPNGRIELPLVEGVIDEVDVEAGVVRLPSRDVLEPS